MEYESLKLSREAFAEVSWLAAELKSIGRILDAWCWTEEADKGWRKLIVEATCGGARSRTEQLCRCGSSLIAEAWPKRKLDPLGLVSIAGAIQGDEVELHTDGEKLLVSARRSKYTLKLAKLEATPPAWPKSVTAYHEVATGDLSRILGRTRFAIDRSCSQRYAVGASAIELQPKKAAAVGTNGCRLAADEVKAKAVGGHAKKSPLLIFPEAARLVDAMCRRAGGDVQVWESGNLAAFATRQHTLMTPTVEGRYPDWREMTNRWDGDAPAATFEIHAGDLARAVAVGSICCDRDNLAVQLTLSAIGVLVEADHSKNGESSYSLPSVGYQGDDVAVYLDHRPLKKWLSLIEPSELLRVRIHDDMFRAESEDGTQFVLSTMSRQVIDEKNAANEAAAVEEEADPVGVY